MRPNLRVIRQESTLVLSSSHHPARKEESQFSFAVTGIRKGVTKEWKERFEERGQGITYDGKGRFFKISPPLRGQLEEQSFCHKRRGGNGVGVSTRVACVPAWKQLIPSARKGKRGCLAPPEDDTKTGIMRGPRSTGGETDPAMNGGRPAIVTGKTLLPKKPEQPYRAKDGQTESERRGVDPWCANYRPMGRAGDKGSAMFTFLKARGENIRIPKKARRRRRKEKRWGNFQRSDEGGALDRKSRVG